jgi:hypothetical protein
MAMPKVRLNKAGRQACITFATMHVLVLQHFCLQASHGVAPSSERSENQ